MRRPLVLAAVLGACLLPAAAHAQTAADPAAVARGEDVMQVNQGRTLFLEGCATCHGQDAAGTARAPDLHGVGAQSADFYLRTGRMPLAVPGESPLQQSAGVPGGRDPGADRLRRLARRAGRSRRSTRSAGDLSEGERLFTLFCAGCHGKLAKGGVVTGAIAPSLDEATQAQIAEAIRVGPFVMPCVRREARSTRRSSTPSWPTSRRPRTRDNAGGWDLGRIGPIPEGMVAFFIGRLALLLVSRLIGERDE